MNKQMKAKWLEALKSGKYKKAKKTLRTKKDNRFCCLGVLCDISNEGEWNSNKGNRFSGSSYTLKNRQIAVGGLTQSQLENYGINSYQHSELVILNDQTPINDEWESVIKYIDENL